MPFFITVGSWCNKTPATAFHVASSLVECKQYWTKKLGEDIEKYRYRENEQNNDEDKENDSDDEEQYKVGDLNDTCLTYHIPLKIYKEYMSSIWNHIDKCFTPSALHIYYSKDGNIKDCVDYCQCNNVF